MKDKLQQKLEQLKQERDLFLEEANKRLAFLNGQVAVLEELLKEA